ncbi:MAG: glycosyltransferase [Chlamydiales bacterium]
MKYIKKMAQLLQEALPAKRSVYFIYTHKNGYDRFAKGMKANTEISFWCYKALSQQFPRVRFLRLQGEKPSRIRKIRPQDVVIGHCGETFLKASERTRRLIGFIPWTGHEDRFKIALSKAEEMHFHEKSASLILLTSEFNKREYLDRPGSFWHDYFRELQKTKNLRLVHQPIDLTFFRRIKFEYTTHHFLYIGNAAPMKGVEDSKRLVQSVGKKLYLYGIGNKKIDHLNQSQVAELPRQADFFIQPGKWEGQCVSILESAARGFIPIVSPQTGYPYSHPYLLRYGDFDYNLKILKRLLGTSPEERKQLADLLHQQLSDDVNHNNWTRLTDVLVQEVEKIL